MIAMLGCASSIYNLCAVKTKDARSKNIETDLLHANVLGLDTPPTFLILRATGSSGSATNEHPVLDPQVAVAHALEHTAQLEGPGDRLLATEKVAHLHRVTKEPCSQDGDTESVARARTMIGDDLRDREDSFNSKTDAAQQANVGGRLGEGGDVEDEKNADKVSQEHPVSRGGEVSIGICFLLFARCVSCSPITYGLVLRHCQKS